MASCATQSCWGGVTVVCKAEDFVAVCATHLNFDFTSQSVADGISVWKTCDTYQSKSPHLAITNCNYAVHILDKKHGAR